MTTRKTGESAAVGRSRIRRSPLGQPGLLHLSSGHQKSTEALCKRPPLGIGGDMPAHRTNTLCTGGCIILHKLIPLVKPTICVAFSFSVIVTILFNDTVVCLILRCVDPCSYIQVTGQTALRADQKSSVRPVVPEIQKILTTFPVHIYRNKLKRCGSGKNFQGFRIRIENDQTCSRAGNAFHRDKAMRGISNPFVADLISSIAEL